VVNRSHLPQHTFFSCVAHCTTLDLWNLAFAVTMPDGYHHTGSATKKTDAREMTSNQLKELFPNDNSKVPSEALSKAVQRNRVTVGKQRKQSTRTKPHRFRPGTKALIEIRQYQKAANMLIPFLPFTRMVRGVTEELTNVVNTRFQRAAMLLLQSGFEDHCIQLLGNANRCAIHAKRVTVRDADVQLAQDIFQTQRRAHPGMHEPLTR
jgi:histone H3